MKKITLSLILYVLFIGFSNAQNTCADATSLCGSFGIDFPSTIGNISAEPDIDYGCLGSQPRPNWFYIPIITTGNVAFQISQTSGPNGTGAGNDVDFIVWGPFEDVTCSPDDLSPANQVDCSFSAAAVEQVEIQNVQPGEVYMLMVTNYSTSSGFIRMTETNGGDFFDTVDCTGFTLSAFVDANGNNTRDEGEALFPYGDLNYSVNSSNEVALSNDSGSYYIFDENENNSYDFEYIIDDTFTDYFSLENPSIQNQFITQGEITNFDIPIDIITPLTNISIHITPTNSPNPGFDTEQLITIKNLGTSQIDTGTISYTFDPNTTFVSSSDPNTTQLDNTLTISFTDLAPFETRNIYIVLNTNAPPEVNIDDVLMFSASVDIGDLEDVYPEDNSSQLELVVIGSFDPNDKLESHGGSISYPNFTTDDYLYYTIRFQNTGTASAQNVEIKDFLTDEHDASSLVMLSASHEYQLKIDNQDLEWEFRNINLPDSTNDEPNSHGFVSFKIKPTIGFDINTIFENTAEIYFDFNLPIITNTAITTFKSRLSINELENEIVRFYPNPTKGDVFITSKQLLKHIEITNMLGQTLLSKTLNTLNTSIDMSSFDNGNYFISLQTDNGKVTKPIVKN
jgi:uncharacterized repeat protein (TIGR01451 family)